MHSEGYAKLLEDVEREILLGARSIGVLGLTTVALRLLEPLTPSGLVSTVNAVYGTGLDGAVGIPLSVPLRPVT
jgi:hypothetical protein